MKTRNVAYSEIGKWRKTADNYIFRPSPNENDNTAAKRLTSGKYVDVNNSVKFKLSREYSFFSIGSCFARNIEEVLLEEQIRVLSRDIDIHKDHYVADARPNAVLNKYSTHSIESEIMPALNNDLEKAKNGIVQIGDDLYFDGHLSHIKPNSLHVIREIREQVFYTTRKITDADVVFITLGQNEVWFDKELNSYLNAAPPPLAMKKYRDRYLVSFPGYQENYDSIKRVVKTLFDRSNKKVKIILTVSPVPMGVTLSYDDVISANTYSKGVLRVCAQELTSEYERIDYFPSYEMVMNSPRSMAWEKDQVHVKDDMVRFVTGKFIERYF